MFSYFIVYFIFNLCFWLPVLAFTFSFSYIFYLPCLLFCTNMPRQIPCMWKPTNLILILQMKIWIRKYIFFFKTQPYSQSTVQTSTLLKYIQIINIGLLCAAWPLTSDPPCAAELDHINPAHTISAALCYATQLVTILSHILDVNLPKKLCNRYLLLPSLTEQRQEIRASGSWMCPIHVCEPFCSSASSVGRIWADTVSPELWANSTPTSCTSASPRWDTHTHTHTHTHTQKRKDWLKRFQTE